MVAERVATGRYVPCACRDDVILIMRTYDTGCPHARSAQHGLDAKRIARIVLRWRPRTTVTHRFQLTSATTY